VSKPAKEESLAVLQQRYARNQQLIAEAKKAEAVPLKARAPVHCKPCHHPKHKSGPHYDETKRRHRCPAKVKGYRTHNLAECPAATESKRREFHLAEALQKDSEALAERIAAQIAKVRWPKSCSMLPNSSTLAGSYHS